MAVAGPLNRKGPKGEAGPRGDVGPKGAKGDKGDQGPQGAQGPSGGGGRVSIKDEGTLLGKAKFIDFTGSAVTATLSGDVATVNVTGGGGGGGGTTTTNVTIPQLNSDPASPTEESAWVRYTAATGAGRPVGLLLAILQPPSGGSLYEFRYRTKEGTTLGVVLT